MNKATIELTENDLRHLCGALRTRVFDLGRYTNDEVAINDTTMLHERIIAAFVDQGVLPKSAGDLLIGGGK